MKQFLLIVSLLVAGFCQAATNPVVTVNTTLGEIDIELFTKEAPISTKNFLDYVNSDYYNGTIFHRVIPGFVVQAGGVLPSGEAKPGNAPVKNEATNGLHNNRGMVTLARSADIDSATTHFFINLADNLYLDHSDKDYGYAVFGKVVRGMDVVDKMAAQPLNNELPVTPIIINKMTVKK